MHASGAEEVLVCLRDEPVLDCIDPKFIAEYITAMVCLNTELYRFVNYTLNP